MIKNDIIEVILELVLEGVIEAAGSKSVPMPVRIFLTIIILALLFGVCGLVIGMGISSGNVVLTIIGVGLLLVFTVMGYSKIKKFKKRVEK